MRRRAEVADDVVSVQIPRSCLTVVERPRCVSQRTSERVVGIPRRTFLDLLREYREAGGTVLEAGKLRIVELDHFLLWLKERAPAPTKPKGDDVAAYAAELGLKEART